MISNQIRALCVLAVATIVAAVSGVGAGAAPIHTLIEGTGSSWSANAVAQWVADVNQQGMEVAYTPTGSAAGRRDFSYNTNDFAVSDIPFQGEDPLTHAKDTAEGRLYAYLPIVAGGTSFPYQIRVGGQLYLNLRLSGETVAKIFTNVITNWNDPQITADNNGHKLPSKPIIPVVHSEGSGATAQFTRYLANQFPTIWTAWSGIHKPTEYYPVKNNIVPQDKSDGVMNFIRSAAGDGSIGYNEYSYALGAGYPVAKLLNKNGYFTLPTDTNVAVSLTSAEINNDPSSVEYLIQNLDKVYIKPDNRTYPLSSYSYLVLPTGKGGKDDNEHRMTTAKRQTLADFLSYSVCIGQRAMGPLGYSPLPINLVQASFEQITKLKTADPLVEIAQRPVDQCNNPTFVAGHPEINRLAEIAPMPPECDKIGNGPCTGVGPGGGGGNGNGGGHGGGAGNNGRANSGGGAGGSGAAGSSSTSASAEGAAGAQIDPETGQSINGADSGTNSQAVATPTDLASFREATNIKIIAVLLAVLLLAALFAPPLLQQRFAARRRGSTRRDGSEDTP